ncbi:hypothetical protein [Nonomuraea sp. JJY05]
MRGKASGSIESAARRAAIRSSSGGTGPCTSAASSAIAPSTYTITV